VRGDAYALSYPNGSFDFLFCVDVIHHVSRPELFLNEAFRVLTAEGQLCIATDSEWTIRNRNPLSVYFPETVEKELDRYPSFERLKSLLADCGFSEAKDEIVELRYELEKADAYKEKAFSCLQLISESAFVTGLQAMERDLSHGPVSCVDRHALLSATKKKYPP
jgi:ubiquinone/menaquinone biosynthesis C-methylase UbiE